MKENNGPKPKGICKRCAEGAKATPGKIVHCSHNSASAIFLDMYGVRAWLTYSPITKDQAEAIFTVIKISFPVFERAVIETVNQQPQTND